MHAVADLAEARQWELEGKDPWSGINKVLTNCENTNIDDIKRYKRPYVTRAMCKTAAIKRIA